MCLALLGRSFRHFVKLNENCLFVRRYASGVGLEKLIYSSMDKWSEAMEEQREAFDPSNMVALLMYNIMAGMVLGT